jgi:hypothetical protein
VRSAFASVSRKSGCANWRGETFTATRIARPSRRHCAARRHAAFSTHAPSGTMIRLSSAIAMNSPGGWSRPLRSRQRTNASTATTTPLRASTIGW